MSKNQNEERLAAIAFILDRVEQFAPTSSTRAFASELVAGLAEGRHVDCARAGEYDVIGVNYFCRLATTILAGPTGGSRGVDLGGVVVVAG